MVEFLQDQTLQSMRNDLIGGIQPGLRHEAPQVGVFDLEPQVIVRRHLFSLRWVRVGDEKAASWLRPAGRGTLYKIAHRDEVKSILSERANVSAWLAILIERFFSSILP
jgi:hypothetical protein